MERRHSSKGQSLSEYGILGVLVAVAAIGGLTLMGGGLKVALGNMFGSFSGPSPAAVQKSALATPPSNITSQPSQSPSLNHSPTLNPSLGSATGIANLVETLGVDGSTEALASQMGTLAQTLLAQGQITPEQANTITLLANQGHRMAQIEQLVSNAVSQSKTVGDFLRTQITFEGKTYDAKAFSSLLGTDTGYGLNDLPEQFSSLLNLRNVANPELASFLKLYQQAQQSGAVSNPAVGQEVAQMASQISYLGNVTMNTAWGLESEPSSSISSYKTYVNDLVTNAPTEVSKISSVTNTDSARICTAGTGHDNGQQCN